MRKIQEILRLKHACGYSLERISKSCGVGKTTVHDCLGRARLAGLSWPLPAELNDHALEQLLYPPSPSGSKSHVSPDWEYIHTELKKKNVTQLLLWQEYKRAFPDGYQYSRFCDLYNEWRGKLPLSMRSVHKAGEKLFVDYAGHTIPIHDPRDDEVKQAQIFVAVLGASSYTYAEATYSQKSEDWIRSHIRAFEFFGGAPEILVPDNLKSGVTKTCRYDPDINPTYHEMARHYGAAVIPARPHKPKDKAKAEAGVQVVERWILAALRKRTFFSLEELNSAISE